VIGAPGHERWRSADLAAAHAVPAASRPEVRGKFLYVGDRKLYVKGVTYGTFRPDEHGDGFPSRETVEGDFARMAENGLNAVRTYTPPPRWLLDTAQRHGLLVLAGFAWEQHVAFLDDRGRPADIERRLRAAVGASTGHPALLGWTIGNEIPAAIVRWHGRERVQRFLRRLYSAAKDVDPDALVTYVNFPSTEYLELPFIDFVCFNVYLEERDRLEAYLARLHSLAGERPVLMAEIGLDSRRNGDAAQAQTLGWQVEATFEAGVAGAFIFAWTDEWYITHLDHTGKGQGGSPIEDWDFGLTDRARRPKPALRAVRDAFAKVPIAADADWPRVSVVVCSFNGERTLAGTLAGACALEYPDFEVIVVDDGSTDATADVAATFPVRVITTENRGLSSARNTGIREASGEIVAFTDDDARPDPHWLLYLVAAFRSGGHAAVGGPNLPPGGDGLVADCVAAAPGGPAHVLLSDREAEHIPGCNSAFVKRALEEIGGFDPLFRVAGDDVDACWRIQEAGGSIGFAPAAVVWHHPRSSVPAYLRQQRGYGKAEAMLERKWPDRYNATGHLSWRGRLYGRGVLPALRRRTRVYHGSWNTGLFQSLYDAPPSTVNQLAQTPEWAFVIAVLGALSLLGVHWWPLLAFVPFVVAAVGALVAQAVVGALHARFPTPHRGLMGWRARALTALLFLLQPFVRLRGRVAEGLTPWRRRATCRRVVPWRRCEAIWSTSWRAPEAWLADLERSVRSVCATTVRGGDFDPWDLEIRGGLLGGARVTAAVEEHGAGLQMVRCRIAPRISPVAALLVALCAILALGAALHSAWIAAGVLGSAAAAIVAELARECGYACGAALASPGRARAPAGAARVERPEPAGVDA
jgi:O-antigen biosynthesis protein